MPTMRTPKRNCATARRIEKLKQLGRLADEVLTPEAADIVLGLIGDELVSRGISPLADPKATTVH